MATLEERSMAALNKLAKWRSVFAGWQLGTRVKGDPEYDAVRDHREVTILLRAEVNVLTKILLDAQVCTQQELLQAMTDEAALLEQGYEQRFPGIKAVEDGMQFDARAAETMKGWRP